MAEHRAATKGRRMGSSRRKQLREGSGEAAAAASGPIEELPRASEIVQRVPDFFRERNKDQAGFVTRSDMQKLQEEDFPCSMEELELIFNGLDAAGAGRLSTEEFTARLCQFLSSQKAARDHRRRKTASRRVRLVLPSPALEGADSEEQRQFAAFMDQLGTANASEEQEIWQLWVKLWQDEPQLLGNLEDFLAKMRHRIQEARSKKEALEVTLNKHVAEHDKEVQQLCEALEQQIQQEQQRLEQESMARSHQHSMELQQALDASEREVQRLVTAQRELETRCHSLRSMQQATSTENRQLEESNRVLEDRLQHLHQQLQQTHRSLQTARATLVREHVEEPRDREVAELPGEMPLSPQISLEKSEKYLSEMQIRMGSQSTKPKAKSTHQVVWEALPAEISIMGAPLRASSTDEDPFAEFLKEEHFSDQSSLLREMNDAIVTLSKQLKPQGLGAPPALADAACHPQNDAELQTGPEASAAHGTTPRILQETLPGHVGHELFEGDLKEGPATAELCAPDTTRAGASVGARHRGAQEPGAEQGESPEEAQRMIFLQGKGAGVKEMMLKAAEHLQGAPGESVEAAEQVLVEVEGEGWIQEKMGWEKAQLLGEAEESALNQGENLEAGLGSPEAGETGLAVGWQLATDELGPAAALEECAQPPGAEPGEEADLPSGVSEKLEIQPGEHLEAEPPSWGEAQMGAAQGDDVLPEVTVAPDPGMPEEEHISAEAQPWGETLDADVPPAQAQHGASSRAGAEEGEMEVTQPWEAEQQPQGESVRGDAMWGVSVGEEALLPPADTQEGGKGTDVQPLEAQSSDANVQLLAEVAAALQPPGGAGSLGAEQGGSTAPGVQPPEEDDKPELGMQDEIGAAMVLSEGPSPAETATASLDLCGLFPDKAQALELVKEEDSQGDVQQHGGASPETPRGGEGPAVGHFTERREHKNSQFRLPQQPVLHPPGAAIRQGEGAAAGVQPPGEAVILDTLEAHSTDADVQMPAEEDELRWTPGTSMEADLQPVSEAGSLDTGRRGSMAPDVQPLDEADKPELVEMEAEDTQADTELHGGLNLEAPRGGVGGAAMQLMEEAEDGGYEQSEHGLPQEQVLDPQGAGAGPGEGAGAGMQPQEEAGILETLVAQSLNANMQPLTEMEELKSAPGGSMEADLQPVREAGSLDTEQGGSVAPDVEPLDQADKPELVEMLEEEDSWVDTELRGDVSPETPRGGEGPAVGHFTEHREQEQGKHGLRQQLVPHPPGVAIRNREGAAAGIQPWKEVLILDMVKGQSPDANVQPLTEEDLLRWTLGTSMEADLQPVSEAGSLDTGRRGSMAPDVQPLDEADKPELVEMEAEDTQADTELHGGLNLEAPRGGVGGAAMQLMEEAEDGGYEQSEHGLPQEPVLHPPGAAIRQEEGAAAGVQPPGEAAILEAHSTDADVQMPAEAEKLKLTPGTSVEADLQPVSEAGSLDTGWRGSMAPDVQPLDEADKPELVEMEAEDTQADTELHGGLNLEAPRGGVGGAAMQLMEEAEDGGYEQSEHGLPQEQVLDPQGAGAGPGEGAGAGMQPQEEAGILETLVAQSLNANMQPLTEMEELKSAPGGSMEADLQPVREAGSLDTEQGGSVAPDVQPLDQADKPGSVEKVEEEDSWVDTELRGDASPETLLGGGICAAMHLMKEAEDGEHEQSEHGLPQEPVLNLQGAGVWQGEGVAGGMHSPMEAVILDIPEYQSTEELKSTPGRSTEAGMAPLGAAWMQEGVQSQTPALEAGLCAAYTAHLWEGAAGADVSSLAEAALDPECATAAKGPCLEQMLGTLAGPDGQILEYTQTLQIPQGESADAEERPLDGAQGLEVLQEERLEAGARILVETRSLGIKQTHDDGASALDPPVSKATLQISTLKLEPMMQEDVLVPDVWRLGASGQAAQSELQEQVSAQADKMSLHAASQQLEKKLLHGMEMERGAAGPAKPPKQEVPPVSTIHARVQEEEEAGSDQLGMVLRGSSLGDAANSSMQPQRQLLGEQREDLSVGQQEKQQKIGQKMSQEGEPSPGEPGAVTADGAGAAPRGSSEASLDPDHLYNVLFVGDSHVGKTSFLYRLHANTFNPHLTATVGLDYQIKNLVVDNKRFALRLWDSAGQERYQSITKQFFRKADGVVLMYDITSEYSFSDVRYWLSCIQEGAEDGVAILLLGNKTDCAAERQVPTKDGERLAEEHQLMFYECSAASGQNVAESMVSLIRLLKVREDELKNKAEEVPKPPQKKKGCCW
ncbi:ras-related protein Rab-44 [Phalacrocorax aristotelis]|uniref:ras-related protein Rab-44 n=1 Tax=Phalacrocorax aristotelis TaxID=126867 RepID=UPI003F4B5392